MTDQSNDTGPRTTTPKGMSEEYDMPYHMCWLCRREIVGVGIRQTGKTFPRRSLCRVITFSQADNSVSISGIGYRLHRSQLNRRASFVVPSQQEYSVEGMESSSFETRTRSLNMKTILPRFIQDPLSRPGKSEWTFGIHADCWDVVQCSTDNIEACALTWCQALVSLNWKFSTSRKFYRPGSWGSGYQTELENLLLKRRRYRSSSRHNSLGMQRLSNLQALVHVCGPDVLRSSRDRLPLERFDIYPQHHKSETLLRSDRDLSARERRRDIFSTLPEEILHHIFQYTQTADLLKFRLASRTVAYVSRVEALPQHFWFSRFCPGFELSLALPCTYPRFPDWRGMYFLIRRVMRLADTDNPPPKLSSLIGRKYWARRFEPLLELHGSRSTKLLGRPFEWPCPVQSLSLSRPQPESFKAEKTPMRSAVGAEFRRRDGQVRIHSTVSMKGDPPHLSELTGVGISTVCLAGKVYISGLRFFYQPVRTCSGPLKLQTSTSIGYISGNSETVIPIRPRSMVLNLAWEEWEEDSWGFVVCVDNDAIRALLVFSGDSYYPKWIGGAKETESKFLSYVRIPVRSWQRVAASFDHLRMIALGIVPGEGELRLRTFQPWQIVLA